MYENKVHTQNSFFQSMKNDEKLGAYYTDPTVCRAIGRYIELPISEDTADKRPHINGVEPSVGNAVAYYEVLSGAIEREIKSNVSHDIKDMYDYVKHNLDITSYATEINTKSYEELAEKNIIEHLVREDFLTGMKITSKCFSFCFSNPPYGKNPLKDERLELSFLFKISGSLKTDGVLVYVIPEYVLNDTCFIREWISRFDTFGMYRFPERVYKQFKQCVIIGIKKRAVFTRKNDKEVFMSTYEKMQDIDMNYSGTRVKVPTGLEKDVRMYTTFVEDPDKNIKAVSQSSVFKNIALEQKPYRDINIGQPIVGLSNGCIQILSITGCGQGKAGSIEKRNLHLQRGTVKDVVHSRIEYEEKKQKRIETYSHAACLTIVQNDGTITRLQ